MKETLYFPCFDVEMKKALLRLSANNQECFSYLDFHRLCVPLREMFLRFGPDQHLEALNELARCYLGFDVQAERKSQAIVEYACPAGPMETVLLAQKFWEFTVIPGVHMPEEYGIYDRGVRPFRL